MDKRRRQEKAIYDHIDKILAEADHRGVRDTLLGTWRYRRLIKFDSSDENPKITPKKGWKYFSRLAREGRLGMLPVI